jgi:hypothetical protein
MKSLLIIIVTPKALFPMILVRSLAETHHSFIRNMGVVQLLKSFNYVASQIETTILQGGVHFVLELEYYDNF